MPLTIEISQETYVPIALISDRRNVKEREGRRLGRRAAWNNVVFCFHSRNAKNKVKKKRDRERDFVPGKFPEWER